jgi:hypothetical protein
MHIVRECWFFCCLRKQLVLLDEHSATQNQAQQNEREAQRRQRGIDERKKDDMRD